MKGRDEKYVRIISAYRPNDSKGPNSVLQQQIRYFREKKHCIDPKPIALFDRDLKNEITKWMEMGDQIILGIDANDTVDCGQFSDQMLEVGLTEAVSPQHPLKSPPATYNRNTNRSTIDGLFVSFGVEVTQAGMLAFDSD